MTPEWLEEGNGLSEFIVIEHGERVYPCRCGETHRGPQAWAAFGHHNCFHNSPLISMHRFSAEMDENHYLCPDCGKDFWLAQAATTGEVEER
jgi:hypothetical protein